MALVKWFIIIGVFSSVYANFKLDPGRDPVLQRLEIPAHPAFTSDHPNDNQQLLKKSRGIPNVVVEAGHPFSLTLPKDFLLGHVITHHKVS